MERHLRHRKSFEGPLRVLYVTRKFPPSIGGMETASYELFHALSHLTQVDLVSYGGPNKLLPIAYPRLFASAIRHGLSDKPEVVYLQDGLLAPFATALRLATHCPVITTIHGLDLTFDNQLYQHVVVPRIGTVDGVVANSRNTASIVSERFPDLPVNVIHYGVRDDYFLQVDAATLRAELESELAEHSVRLGARPVLLTTGRMVKRKGVAWFIDEVMPELVRSHPDILYLVTGTGPMREEISTIVSTQGLAGNVILLGRVSDRVRNLLYNISDLFIMPNIRVHGDVEGFGLVATEASSCGTPVIGSNIEGVADAIIDGETGFPVAAGDQQEWVRTISRELSTPTLDRHSVRACTLTHYSWSSCAQGYLNLFEALVHDHG